MMKCEYCGYEVKDGLNFCPKCGKTFKTNGGTKGENPNRSLLPVLLCILILSAAFIVYIFINAVQKKAVNHNPSSKTEAVLEEETGDEQAEAETEKEDTVYSVVDNPQYNTLEIKKYNLVLSYPDHFTEVKSDDENALLLLKDPNGAADLSFYAVDNPLQLSSAEVAKEALDTFAKKDCKLLDEYISENRFYQKYRSDNTIYYLSGIVMPQSMCFFNFLYAEFESHVYENYFKYINENFRQAENREE